MGWTIDRDGAGRVTQARCTMLGLNLRIERPAIPHERLETWTLIASGDDLPETHVVLGGETIEQAIEVAEAFADRTAQALVWRTAAQMAALMGTSETRVIGYIRKLDLTDPESQHLRGEGPAREYSPAAQGLIDREWRSYGRPR